MRKALMGILMAATAATPLAAQDDNRSDRARGRAQAEQRAQDRAERQEHRQEVRAERQEVRAERQAARVERAQPQPQPQPQPQTVERVREQPVRAFERAQRRDDNVQTRQQRAPAQVQRGRTGTRETWRRSDDSTQVQRDTVRTEGRRDWQGDRRDGNWQGRDGRRDQRVEHRDDRRDWRHDRRDNNRRWNRNWRNDHRYDWQRWRYSNRNIFRGHSYYAPYRNHRYSRLSIGLVLNSLFFSNRYWIGDPWQYRLPPAYEGTRWVRYYNDVLLIDLYTGEVIDVIYDFFW